MQTLLQYLAKLANDPAAQQTFAKDPEAAITAADLDDHDKAVLRTRNPGLIQAHVGRQGYEALIYGTPPPLIYASTGAPPAQPQLIYAAPHAQLIYAAQPQPQLIYAAQPQPQLIYAAPHAQLIYAAHPQPSLIYAAPHAQLIYAAQPQPQLIYAPPHACPQLIYAPPQPALIYAPPTKPEPNK